MKFSTVYASPWRISNDISTFQTFLHYSLIRHGEENVSWRDDRGVGGPSELILEAPVFVSISLKKLNGAVFVKNGDKSFEFMTKYNIFPTTLGFQR